MISWAGTQLHSSSPYPNTGVAPDSAGISGAGAQHTQAGRQCPWEQAEQLEELLATHGRTELGSIEEASPACT